MRFSCYGQVLDSVKLYKMNILHLNQGQFFGFAAVPEFVSELSPNLPFFATLQKIKILKLIEFQDFTSFFILSWRRERAVNPVFHIT